MKTLIILLFPVLCMGQVVQDTSHKKEVFTVLELYQEYYEGLPLVEISKPCPDGRVGCAVHHGWIKVKQPTFDGFLVWLRRKKSE